MTRNIERLPFIARIRTWSAIATLLVLGVIAAAPLDLASQSLLAMVTVLVLMAANWIEPSPGVFRTVLFLIIVFTSTRYMIWRVNETLPIGDPVGFFFGLLLFGAELYGYVILLLSTFLSVDTLTRAPKPAPIAADDCPTVDILIPSYNEDEVLLEVTLRAAMNVNYPQGKKKVYLCDDGGTVQKRTQADAEKAAEALERHERLKKLCERTGATYLTREKNLHAKAGNVNSALMNHTSGELVLILDADHVPTTDILTRTVGYFREDPKLFLVQTPHFFINPDPLERNLDTFDKMPSENEMFYSVIQKGLDGYNASFFCGSAAVLRRSCLEEIGGIQGDTITEDAETALELHARGYRSAYVARPMVAGLSPETFTGFIVQRMRWAQGMVQIFLLKNPLTKRGLTLSQRLGYLNSCFYWFFPLARMTFVLAPLVYLFFGIEVYKSELPDFLAYGAPHIVGALLLSSTLYGRTRWALASELYEILQAIHCSRAIFQVLRNPHAPTFAVTPKGESLDDNFISPLSIPFYILLAVVFLGQIVGIARMVMVPETASYVSVLLVWNTFHLVLLIGALGALYERSQRRAFPRLSRNQCVSISTPTASVSGNVTDVSITGAGISVDHNAKIATGDIIKVDAFELGAPYSMPIHLQVKSTHPGAAGVQLGLSFQVETPEDWHAIVAIVYARSSNWQSFQKRRNTPGEIAKKVGFIITRSFDHAYDHIQAIRKVVRP
ncbi:MAG: UDP-forming cellulose synthase catalytic subunit [Pseudomonadota bacterium]